MTAPTCTRKRLFITSCASLSFVSISLHYIVIWKRFSCDREASDVLGILAYDVRAACLGMAFFAGGFGWRFRTDSSSSEFCAGGEEPPAGRAGDEGHAVEAVAPADLILADKPAVAQTGDIMSVDPDASSAAAAAAAADTAAEPSSRIDVEVGQESHPFADPYVLQLLQHRLDTSHPYIQIHSSNLWTARKRIVDVSSEADPTVILKRFMSGVDCARALQSTKINNIVISQIGSGIRRSANGYVFKYAAGWLPQGFVPLSLGELLSIGHNWLVARRVEQGLPPDGSGDSRAVFTRKRGPKQPRDQPEASLSLAAIPKPSSLSDPYQPSAGRFGAPKHVDISDLSKRLWCYSVDTKLLLRKFLNIREASIQIISNTVKYSRHVSQRDLLDLLDPLEFSWERVGTRLRKAILTLTPWAGFLWGLDGDEGDDVSWDTVMSMESLVKHQSHGALAAGDRTLDTASADAAPVVEGAVASYSMAGVPQSVAEGVSVPRPRAQPKRPVATYAPPVQRPLSASILSHTLITPYIDSKQRALIEEAERAANDRDHEQIGTDDETTPKQTSKPQLYSPSKAADGNRLFIAPATGGTADDGASAAPGEAGAPFGDSGSCEEASSESESQDNQPLTEEDKLRMSAEGWTFNPEDNPYIGLRARKFFPKGQRADGTITAHLPVEVNDGLELFFFVHDDHDNEDLEIHEVIKYCQYFQDGLKINPEVP